LDSTQEGPQTRFTDAGLFT